MEVDEVERPREGGDAVGGAVLGSFEPFDQRPLVLHAAADDSIEATVFASIGLVDGLTCRAVEVAVHECRSIAGRVGHSRLLFETGHTKPTSHTPRRRTPRVRSRS